MTNDIPLKTHIVPVDIPEGVNIIFGQTHFIKTVEDLYETAEQKDIDIRLPYVLEEIVSDASGGEIDRVRIRNVETDEIEQLKVDGVFIFA